MSIKSEKIDGKNIVVEIQSTNLKSASYDTESETLSVTFNNGSIYEYNKVPWSIFTKLRLAESQGKYFNENISRKYKYLKIQ